jgi:hypothetical protein
MALDPSISLGVRPAQPIDDPVEGATRMLSLRQMMEEAPMRRQMLQQQTRIGQMQIEESERDIADQRTVQQAYAEAQGDLDKLSKLVAGKISPKSQTALNNAALAYKKSIAEISKEQLAAYKTKTEIASSEAQTLLSLKPEARAGAYPTSRARLIAAGAITADQFPEVYPGDEFLTQAANRAILADKQIDNALREKADVRADAKQKAELPGIVADSLGKQFDAGAREIGSVANQAQYDEWLARQPENVRGRYPAMFSPATVELVRTMAKTPHQLTTEAQTAANAQATTLYRQDMLKLRERGINQSAVNAERTAGRLTLAATAGNEARLRDDYRQDSKNYSTVRDAYGRIMEAAKSKGGPAEISLLYGYMRLLDPGSTVREGEFATAANAGSIPERVYGAYNKALKGEAMAPSIKAQFVKEAENVYKRATEDHGQMGNWYRDVAVRSGMNPDNVIVDYSTSYGKQGGGKRPGAGGLPGVGQTYNGGKVTKITRVE